MNYLARRAITGVILGLSATWAMAQQATINSPAPVSVGTNSVDVTIDFDTMGMTVTGFGFNVTYDNANLIFSGCTSTLTTCADLVGGNSGTVNIGALSAPPANPVATLNFDASGAAAAMYPIDPAAAPPPSYTDAAFADQPLTVNGGTLTVQVGPGPGVLNVQPPTLNPPTAAVNGPATTGQITISNDGLPGDATFTPSCSLGAVSGTPGVSISVPPFNSSLAPGASSMVTASCSGTAAGSAMATYTCTAAGPTVTNDNTVITCDTAAGAPIPNPPGGSNVSLLVGPVVRGNSGTATQTFAETGGSGGTYDVACNITDTGGGAFSLPGANGGTVPSGGSIGVVVAGQSTAMDPQPTGTMVCTYSGGTTGTVTVALGITLIPEIVPTLSQWGLILMVLALVGFGAYRLRHRTNVA